MSSHHHKEQRQVAATACPIAIQVDPQAHLVAVFTGIEGCEIMDTVIDNVKSTVHYKQEGPLYCM